jgi:flagellar biosynthesis protein FlhA
MNALMQRLQALLGPQAERMKARGDGADLRRLMLAMMVLPLPPFAARPAVHLQHRAGADGDDGGGLHGQAAGLRGLPTVLLVTTLLRLSLNVASTRVVLMEGHTGPGAAGKVIESFGHFLIGGNFAVGLIVFAILVVINFVVVTKGAERIAEGRRALHPRRDAGQADGDRRRPERRPDRREGSRAPRRGRRGGRLLRLDGRRQQVRARRCDGRAADPVHQHRRRLRIIGMLQHGLSAGAGGRQLHPAGGGRRAGGADPGAADLGGRGDGRLARRQGAGHRQPDPRPGVRLAAALGITAGIVGCWA